MLGIEEMVKNMSLKMQKHIDEGIAKKMDEFEKKIDAMIDKKLEDKLKDTQGKPY